MKTPAEIAELVYQAHYAIAASDRIDIANYRSATYEPSQATLRAIIRAAYPEIDSSALVDQVLEVLADSGESVAYCVSVVRARQAARLANQRERAHEYRVYQLAEVLAPSQFGAHVERHLGRRLGMPDGAEPAMVNQSTVDAVAAVLMGGPCCGQKHIDPDPTYHWSLIAGCTEVLQATDGNTSRGILCGRPMAEMRDEWGAMCEHHRDARNEAIRSGSEY